MKKPKKAARVGQPFRLCSKVKIKPFIKGATYKKSSLSAFYAFIHLLVQTCYIPI